MALPTTVRHSLTGADWTCRLRRAAEAAPAELRDRDLPARVPGCVHADLIAAGLIEHPNQGRAEERYEWVGDCDWQYRCRFRVAADLLRRGRIELVCEGLDTICTLWLNGREIGSAANQFHPHRFEVRDCLRAGENELLIDFVSPTRYVERECQRLGKLPYADFGHPYPYIRKSACNFGWDWGPGAPTVGVWRDIYLLAWDRVRLGELRVVMREVNQRLARFELVAGVEGSPAPGDEVALAATLHCPEGRRLEASTPISDQACEAVLGFELPDPPLWWPRGYGPQHLCHLSVALRAGGQLLEGRRFELGLRSVRLDDASDEHGSRFQVVVNDVPVFCKGANWIPDDVLAATIAPRRYAQRVAQAAAANMNMLRVWGGGIYEHEEFYRLCDRLGIMVWQDFMFTCAAYPQAEPLWSQVEAEARHNIARLSRHASVVLLCGGNECLMNAELWKLPERLPPGARWGADYYFELLPRLVQELEPPCPYWPNSPYSAARERSVFDADHGNQHVWNLAVEQYRREVPRFVSEFGHQGPANYATWCEALPPAELGLRTAAMEHRQRAADGNQGRYDQFIGAWFGPVETFDRWLYAAQLLQARAVALGIEWWRAHRPRCMGVLFWQLNDCWAAHSWSAIDYAGRPKLLWYAARSAFDDHLLCIHPVDDRPALLAVNDRATLWQAQVRLRRVRFDGTVLADQTRSIEVPPASARRVADLHELLGRPDDPAAELLVADGPDGRRACWFYRRDRALRYPEPRYELRVVPDETGLTLEIVAHTLLREVCLAVDRLDPEARVSGQLLTLLPGETARLHVQSSRSDLQAEHFAAEPVFNCANRLGRGK